MNRSPHAHESGPGPGRREALLRESQPPPAALDVVVIQPEFAAGAKGAFPEVRLVRARCGDRSGPCAARCPAGSRQIAAGDEGAAAPWVMCA